VSWFLRTSKIICGSRPHSGHVVAEFQLSLDVTQAFYLLGRAEEEEKDIDYAKNSYVSAIAFRNQTVPSGTWDPIRVACLEQLIGLALRRKDFLAWDKCDRMMRKMYDNV
jgi:hypothetical protein